MSTSPVKSLSISNQAEVNTTPPIDPMVERTEKVAKPAIESGWVNVTTESKRPSRERIIYSGAMVFSSSGEITERKLTKEEHAMFDAPSLDSKAVYVEEKNGKVHYTQNGQPVQDPCIQS